MHAATVRETTEFFVIRVLIVEPPFAQVKRIVQLTSLPPLLWSVDQEIKYLTIPTQDEPRAPSVHWPACPEAGPDVLSFWDAKASGGMDDCRV